MRSVFSTEPALARVAHADTCWNTKYSLEDLTCSLAAKRKTALSRRRKSPCPEVHLAHQLEMSLTLSAPVMAASSEDEVEELDVEETLLLAAAVRRAGTEDTDTSTSTVADPSESGP